MLSYKVTSADPIKARVDCLVLGIFKGRKLTRSAQALDEVCDGYLASCLARTGMEGHIGQHLLLIDVPKARAERVLLIGCGARSNVSAFDYCVIVAEAAKRMASSGARSALACLPLLSVERRDTAWKLSRFVAALEDRAYKFDIKISADNKRRGSRSTSRGPALVTLSVSDRGQVTRGRAVCSEAGAIATGVRLARDLGNLPANICTPRYLAKQAQALGKRHRALRVKVLNTAEITKLGMGAFLSVANGSHEPARLIVIEYRGTPKAERPIVLVGKGVTFDTGGISLKPPRQLDEMKFDMCGAASVLGTLEACAALELPIEVVGIIAAAENMPGGGATRPGDVVTSMSGKTIEILDTDAEGRLLLCDALTYAQRYRPRALIDIATLTGSCIVALGRHPHGLFSNSNSLTDALMSAGRRTHDRAWPMPLWQEYQAELDSNFADVANIGSSEGGAVTAACFLSRFVGDARWAHLDIAGTASRRGHAKGATGRPVPLLTQLLIDQVKPHSTQKSISSEHQKNEPSN